MKNIHHVRLGSVVFALTTAQVRLLKDINRKQGRAAYVIGGQVRSAKALAALGFGVLRDDGGIALHDGERWYFELINLPIGDA